MTTARAEKKQLLLMTPPKAISENSWQSSGLGLGASTVMAWVQFMVEELSSCKLCGTAKNIFKIKNNFFKKGNFKDNMPFLKKKTVYLSGCVGS